MNLVEFDWIWLNWVDLGWLGLTWDDWLIDWLILLYLSFAIAFLQPIITIHYLGINKTFNCIIYPGFTAMFLFTQVFAFDLKIFGDILDLMSGGSWLNKAELRQKNPPLDIVSLDWILIMFWWRFGISWFSLKRSLSFLARYFGCWAWMAFWAVTKVE